MKLTASLPAALLLALPLRAAENDAVQQISEACAHRRVEVRLAAAPQGGDQAADMKEADRFLGRHSRIDEPKDAAPVLKWDRGKHGESACREKLTKLDQMFPGRLRFPQLERKKYAQAGERMEGQVPAAVRKDPRDAGLQSSLFDASLQRGAGGTTPVAVPASADANVAVRNPSAPRAAMPASYTRPYAEPPVPGAGGLYAASAEAFRGVSGTTRRGGMAIDTDGDLSRGEPGLAALARRDPYRQSGTAFRYADGSSLDPTRVPFVVVPKGSGLARLGDHVLVSYGGHSVLAVVGDVGPRNKFGEGSMALARALGINASGTSGGVSGGVTYTFLGSRGGRPAGQDVLMAQLASTQSALAMR